MKKKVSVEPAYRIRHLPPYLFAEIDRMKQKEKKKGTDLIDLSIGDPDIPTPKHIVKAMKRAVENPEHHRYPSYEGMLPYREAVARWYKKRFDVVLSPENEVLSLIGSKEGIGHIPLGVCESGRYCSGPLSRLSRICCRYTVCRGKEPFHAASGEERFLA